MTPPRLLRRVLIAIALTAWGLIVAEACVRVMDPQAVMPRYITGTPSGVRGNIPGAVYRHRTPEVDVGYRINSQGLRSDREYPEQKPAGLCRVAMVGDSFFVGYELDYPDTIAARLEKELNDAGLHAEVLNFAVSGFGTAEMLRTYEKRMRLFAPDAVLVQWHETDLDDNPRSGLYELRDDQLVAAADTYLPSVKLQDALMEWWFYRFVADHSQLYSWVRERAALMVKDALLKARAGDTGRSPDAAGHPGVVGSSHGSGPAPTEADAEQATPHAPGEPSAPSPGAELSARLLLELRQRVAADGSEMLVVDIPMPMSRTELQSSWNRLPASQVAPLQVWHAADSFAPLLSPDAKVYFERGHGHITPPAALALARDLARTLHPALAARGCLADRPEQAP